MQADFFGMPRVETPLGFDVNHRRDAGNRDNCLLPPDCTTQQRQSGFFALGRPVEALSVRYTKNVQ
jgi:hypothetical protein